MAKTKICVVCSKPFEIKVANAKFCGKLCRETYRAAYQSKYQEENGLKHPAQRGKQLCAFCLQPFEIKRNRTKFCGQLCYLSHHRDVTDYTKYRDQAKQERRENSERAQKERAMCRDWYAANPDKVAVKKEKEVRKTVFALRRMRILYGPDCTKGVPPKVYYKVARRLLKAGSLTLPNGE